MVLSIVTAIPHNTRVKYGQGRGNSWALSTGVRVGLRVTWYEGKSVATNQGLGALWVYYGCVVRAVLHGVILLEVSPQDSL